jgi:predicted N-formylglutamate amidohydrolase
MSTKKLIISCEHGGWQIPKAYAELFVGHEKELQSHTGWDIGALEVASFLAKATNSPLYSQAISRLLIEMNRSLNNPDLFSHFTSGLDKKAQSDLIQTLYFPYRNRVEEAIEKAMNKGFEVLHLSVHSFTPVWNNQARPVDLGILVDQAFKKEGAVGAALQELLQKHLPEYQVKLNEPYNGADDGFTTYLRNKFDPENYFGIEVEINQRLMVPEVISNIRSELAKSLIMLGC